MKTCDQYTIINPFWEYAHIEDLEKGCQLHLTGCVEGYDNRITTSVIVAYNKDIQTITTKSGSVYKLGAPLTNYATWLINPDEAY